MCIPAAIPALTAAFGGGAAATAAGATAGAATASAWTLGSTLQTIGAVAGIGGSLYQGMLGSQAAKANAAAIADQKKAEAQIGAVEETRIRQQYRRAIRQQSAELAARGIQLDSPTAVLLGQVAGQEMSFAAQGVRQNTGAKIAELSATQQQLEAQGQLDLLKGTTSAAGILLDAAPTLWPELA